jgi:Fe(3+) dicitrate transport protein
MLAVAAAAASPVSAAPQTTPPDTAAPANAAVVRLAPVEVTALGGTLREAGGAVHVLRPTGAEGARALSAGDLLRRVPGVHVQDEDGVGLRVNVGVRGLDPRRSSRVLLLEDGVPVHLAPYADPTAHYQPPPDALERIEVITGAGQVLHGPQTVGGVVNYVRAGIPVRGGVSGGVVAGTGGTLLSRVHAAAVGERSAAAVSAARREVEGPREGWRHRV